MGNNNNGPHNRCNAACQFNVCGDNDLLSGVEQCDDGNRMNGDGCDNNCTVTSCGNGITTSGEACDDGNHVNGDGCDNNCTATACGNGIQTMGEACDDGNQVVETCPYNTSCTVCDATCHLSPGVVPTCGDGNLDGANEVCDDGNNSPCGTCSGDCQIDTPAAAAAGLIFAAAAKDMTDGDTLKVTDLPLVNPASISKTFVFIDSTKVPQTTTDPSQIVILFTPNDSADNNSSMAGKIADAITNSGLAITATHPGTTGVVTLLHKKKTSDGNIAIEPHVATSNFGVFGMSGGQAGNCNPGVGCAIGDDCTSGVCDATTHKCQ